MVLINLILKSLRNRALTSFLTVVSIAFSIALLIGVERVRTGARESFSNTISQTDLVVGAKGGTVQLLLYSVFRLGSATDNVEYSSYEEIRRHPSVEWTIPFSLGDSYRGFRVVGTDENFYERYRFQRDRHIEFSEGRAASELFDVVLGSDVARDLQHKLGDQIALTHGVTDGFGIIQHSDKPFQVVGILKKTSTPVDRSVYITLEGMEAIHIDWSDGAPPMPGKETSPSQLKKEEIEVSQITSFLLRTKNRLETLLLQRTINDYKQEPLMAIIPAVTLNELWTSIGYAEQGLRLVSIFVLVVGFIGMLVSLYTSLESRRREMAILRAVGAGPRQILCLLVGESFLLTVLGIGFGTLLVYVLLKVLQPIIETQFGLFIPITAPTPVELIFVACAALFGLIVGLAPALKAYRNTLSDGLSVRF